MKIYKYICLLLSVLAVSCQEDEKLNLDDYPNSTVVLSALDSKDPLNGQYTATYGADRKLQVGSDVGFKVALSTPALADIVVNLEYYLKNISSDRLELPKQVIIPAGFSEQEIKIEDFSFMDDLAQKDYEVEAKVLSVEKIKGDFIKISPVKLVISKEAFSTSLQLTSKEKLYSFNRIYANGKIINEDKMNLNFKVQLTKALDEDLEVAFNVANLTEQQQTSVTFTPAVAVIPAGSLVSEEITCNIADDFLLEDSEDHEFNIQLSALPAHENEYVNADSKENQIDIDVVKSSNILEQISQGNNWLVLNREGWKVTLGEGLTGRGQNILDGNTATGVSLNGGRFNLSVKLPQEAHTDFLEINYGQPYYAPREIRISTSVDGKIWKSLGTMKVKKPDSYRVTSIFVKFLAPVSSQYFKYEVTGSNSFTNQVVEFNLFQK